MEKQVNKYIIEIVNYIKNSFEYQECLKISSKMENNDEIKSIISKVKVLQKKYVRSGSKDEGIKNELDLTNKRLESIPLYVDYLRNLEKVNDMINLVKDELNDYFDLLLNKNN